MNIDKEALLKYACAWDRWVEAERELRLLHANAAHALRYRTLNPVVLRDPVSGKVYVITLGGTYGIQSVTVQRGEEL
jgi:hypothetical protein